MESLSSKFSKSFSLVFSPLIIYTLVLILWINSGVVQCAKISFEIPDDSSMSAHPLLYPRSQLPSVLSNIHGNLRSQGCVALLGPGQVGKTALAIKFVYDATAKGNYSNFIWIDARNEETLKSSFLRLVSQFSNLIDSDTLPVAKQQEQEPVTNFDGDKTGQNVEPLTSSQLTLFKLKEVAAQVYERLSGVKDLHQTLFIFDGVNSDSISTAAGQPNSRSNRRRKSSDSLDKLNILELLPTSLLSSPNRLEQSSLEISLPHAIITMTTKSGGNSDESEFRGKTFKKPAIIPLTPFTMDEVTEILADELGIDIDPEKNVEARKVIEKLAKVLQTQESSTTIEVNRVFPLTLQKALNWLWDKTNPFISLLLNLQSHPHITDVKTGKTSPVYTQLIVEAISRYLQETPNLDDLWGKENDPDEIFQLTHESDLARQDHQYESALTLKLQAYDLLKSRSKSGSGSRSTSTSTELQELALAHGLAEIYYLQTNYSAALPLFSRSRDLHLKFFGASDDGTLRTLQSVALSHLGLGDYDKSLELLKQVLEGWRVLSLGNGSDESRQIYRDNAVAAMGLVAMVIHLSASSSSSASSDSALEALEIYKNIAEIQETQVEALLWESKFIDDFEQGKENTENMGPSSGRAPAGPALEYFHTLQQIYQIYESLGLYSESLKIRWKLSKIQDKILGLYSRDSIETLEGIANCLDILDYPQNAAQVRVEIARRNMEHLKDSSKTTFDSKQELQNQNKEAGEHWHGNEL